ncbi:MAG: HAD family phosphatase [Clostridia bacterium]|nr:HAD family phosphatase [Clostridia bacterium]
MPRYDMLFFDLDGTLLSSDHRTVSPRNQEALRAARAAGIRLAIATGRCLGMIPREALELELDFAVTSNGAAVYDLKRDQQIFHYPFQANAAAKACEVIERYLDFYELFVGGKVILIRGEQAECDLPPWGHFYIERRGGLPPMTSMRSFVAEGAPGLEKINVIECPRTVLPLIRQELEALGDFALSSSMSYGGLEVVPIACSKGSAIRWLCGELDIGIERCAAFGDSSNDMDMLAAVGCGVAMENAPEDLKASARCVAPPYDQDGIAEFIMRHVM